MKNSINLLAQAKKNTPKTVAVKTPSKRSLANANFKKATFSLSGLIRYAKGEGKKDFLEVIKDVNEKNGTKLTFADVLNTKTILEYSTERELILKDGTQRILFSYYFLTGIPSRIAKAQTKK